MRGADSMLEKAIMVVVEMWNDAPWVGPKGRWKDQQAEIWECALKHHFNGARVVDFGYSKNGVTSYDIAFYKSPL